MQPQKKARGLKFWIQEGQGLYYLCSESKDADQLCGYCAADLPPFIAYAKSRFSHDAAQLLSHLSKYVGNGINYTLLRKFGDNLQWLQGDRPAFLSIRGCSQGFANIRNTCMYLIFLMKAY